MKLRDFALECYFERYEFTAPYLLAQSDCEAMTARELLALEPGSEAGYLDCWLGYTEIWGDPALRERIAALYPGLGPEHILCFHGAQEAILAYLNVMLDAGDHAILMTPNCPSVWEAVRAIPGLAWDPWTIRDGGGRWTVDLDELEGLLRPNTKVIAVNSPNNPTGLTLTNAQLRRLCDLCRDRGIYLFCDEVYKGLEWDGEARVAAATLYEKALSLNVMSKSYGLAGLRVGWAASKDRETLQRLARFKHYTSICDAAPAEYLARIALLHGDALLARNRAIIQGNMQTADAFFARHPAVFDPRPMDAGPVAFHALRLDMGAEEFCRRAVTEQGVLLLPGSVYEAPPQYFRMGYGRRSFGENLNQLELFLRKNKF